MLLTCMKRGRVGGFFDKTIWRLRRVCVLEKGWAAILGPVVLAAMYDSIDPPPKEEYV